MRLVILASGSGSNFEAIVRASQNNIIKSKVKLLIVDKEDAQVIKRAKRLNINYEVLKLNDFQSKEAYEEQIVNLIKQVEGQLICLAGYMKIVSKVFLDNYEGKIINIHPSLLPKYPGKDGLNNSIIAGEEEIGATVHYVNEYIDDGKIIKQVSFNIKNLLPEQIKSKLHKHEHILYVDVIKQLEEEYEKSIN